jgi:putative ABC transport system permease protein
MRTMRQQSATGNRIFRILVRLYPPRARERFGGGLIFGWRNDLDRARRRGAGAVAGFWVNTIIDTCRFALAERRGGFTMRGFLTVDWRDAWRSLRSAPMVTAFCVLSLALGIGGVTALFSILNSLTMKPLPVREPERLAVLADNSWTNPIWEAIRDRRQAFAEDAFAWGNDRFNLSPAATADIVEGFWVSGRMFEVLGVPAAIGRTLTEADDVRGGGAAGPVTVISHAFWQRRYAGAPDIVGKTLLVERVPFTIVGVTQQGFFGPDVGRSFDIALPIGAEPLVRKDRSRLDRRTSSWMNIMARLRPGQTAADATNQLRAIQAEIRQVTMPEGRGAGDRYLVDPFRLAAAPGGRSPLRGRYEQPLSVILGVVGMVLLIACANVANLLIARASDRRHELTLRLALGASRWRVARQLLAESLCLGAAGAALGIWFAEWGSRLLVRQLSSAALVIDLDLQTDWRVLGFATLVTLTATLVFGVAPALSASRLTPNEVLKAHGRAAGSDRRGVLRHASVVVQVAFSLALAAGAGLFTRTFIALDRRDFGVDRHAVLLATANLERNPASGEARSALLMRMVEAVHAVPGVAAAAVSYTTPVARAGRNTVMKVPEGSPLTRRERTVWVNVVSPGWFKTMGLSLVAGRDFDTRDGSGAPLVVAVNRAFARRFLAGADPIGARVATDESGPVPSPPLEVVSLVEDSVYRSVRESPEPTMYLPLAQASASPTMTIAVRPAAGDPIHLARGVAAAMEKVDPTAVLTLRTLDEQIADTMTQERVLATVALFFGGLGLLLAGVGLYGVTSYAVTARRAEIGIRIALGADAGGVVRLVLRRVAWLVAVGVVAGAALSLWAGKYVQTLLYGLEPRDPVAFAAAAVTLSLVAIAAAWIPARRASRIDPMIALRP